MQHLLTTAMVIILLLTNPHVGDVMMTLMQNSKCSRSDFWSILTIGVNRSRYFSNNIKEVMVMIINTCKQEEDMDVYFKKPCFSIRPLEAIIIANHL